MIADNVVIFRELSPYSVGGDYFLSIGCRVIPAEVKKPFNFIIKICKIFNIYIRFLSKLLWGFDIASLSKISLFIFFDSSIDFYLCNYLYHYFSNKRLILYYWNSIDTAREKQINYFKKKTKWDIFSFDLVDCRNYQLKHNKIFSAIPEELCSLEKKEIRQEVFFVGADKGRIGQILQIKRELDKLSISNKILCITFDNVSKDDGIYTDPISYRDVLVEDTHSRAILDINYDDKYGMTMRELESLFLQTKLITNNKKIQERDFYNENNIYIIDYSKSNILDGLKEFLEKPFVPVDKKIMESYSVDVWFQRFLE